MRYITGTTKNLMPSFHAIALKTNSSGANRELFRVSPKDADILVFNGSGKFITTAKVVWITFLNKVLRFHLSYFCKLRIFE